MKQEVNRGASATVVIAVVVGVFILGMALLVLVVGGGIFYARTTQVEMRRARAAELKAMAEVQQTEAAFAAAAAEARQTALANEASFDFSIALDSQGRITLDGMELTRDGLRELLLSRKQLDSTLTVRIKASANCAVKDLTPVLEICDAIDDIKYQISSDE